MTNLAYIKDYVEARFDVEKTEVVDRYQVSFEVKKDDVHRLLSVLKSEGWIQLSYLSAIDWIEENQFELVYIVMNWEKPVYIQVRTRIDRENPVMNSIVPIYPGSKYYERECHEFFGVAFPGNPDYEKQLILEGWDDLPPLRKDFDPKAYSDARFPTREYDGRFTNMNNQKSKQQERTKRKKHIASLRTGGQKK